MEVVLEEGKGAGGTHECLKRLVYIRPISHCRHVIIGSEPVAAVVRQRP